MSTIPPRSPVSAIKSHPSSSPYSLPSSFPSENKSDSSLKLNIRDSEPPPSIQEWQIQAFERLTQSGIEHSEAQSDLRFFLQELFKKSSSIAVFDLTRPFTPSEYQDAQSFIEYRCQRVPFAYIVESMDFWEYTFKVSPAVLIPRSDTEILIEEVLKIQKTQKTVSFDSIVDVGTGSGCIGLTLGCLFPNAHITLIDISKKALEIAQQNGDHLFQQGDLKAQVHYQHASLLTHFDSSKKPDLIVSNPPYIASDVMTTLMPEVQNYEPHLALDGGSDGFDLISPLIKQAFSLLKPQGVLMLEVGWDQTQETEKKMQEEGFIETWIRVDYGGNPRIVGGIKPSI